MSGSGPGTGQTSQSRYTKPLVHQAEYGSAHNTSDSQFKKTTQVVGRPETTDHNIMDDIMKSPPDNLGTGSNDSVLPADNSPGAGQPDTVEAKDPAEIQARLEKS